MTILKRTCSQCTACCEGWLSGEAHSIKFQSGKPCHFKCPDGCSIYNDRPSFCKEFNCEWIQNYNLPEWLKPNISNVIVRKKVFSKAPLLYYFEVLEMGKKIDSVVLNWFFTFYVETGIPLKIMVDGGWFYYGDNKFKDWATNNI